METIYAGIDTNAVTGGLVDVDDAAIDVGEVAGADADDDDAGEANEANEAGGVSEVVDSDLPVETVVVEAGARRTSTKLSEYERTELISIRATQIAQHANCFVDITGLTSPIDQAKREFDMRMTPIVLRRYVGSRIVPVDTVDNDASTTSKNQPSQPGQPSNNRQPMKIVRYYELFNPNEMIH